MSENIENVNEPVPGSVDAVAAEYKARQAQFRTKGLTPITHEQARAEYLERQAMLERDDLVPGSVEHVAQQFHLRQRQNGMRPAMGLHRIP